MGPTRSPSVTVNKMDGALCFSYGNRSVDTLGLAVLAHVRCYPTQVDYHGVVCECNGTLHRVYVRNEETTQTSQEVHLCGLEGWVFQHTIQKKLVEYVPTASVALSQLEL